MKSPRAYLLIIIVIVMLISTASCNRTAATPTPTITPTDTPTPTSTPLPPTASVAFPIPPGDSLRTVKVNDLERTYLLHTPPGFDSLEPLPVVFAFHGWGENASNYYYLPRFYEIVDENGFLLVSPNGTGPNDALSWNAGGNCCGTAYEDNVDEPAFILQILSDLGTIASIDPKRIYATGFSNGGLLVYRLACEMPNTFAAIAPVAGILWWSPCQPEQPVSVMHIHGLADTAILYAGGEDKYHPGIIIPSVEQSIAAWVQLDGCTDSAQVEQLGQVTHTIYASCRAGTAVELYAIKPLDHSWPLSYLFPDSKPAFELIWEFFAAHPKP